MKQTKKQLIEQEKQEAKEYILNLIKGDAEPTFYTILKHVSNSGVMRHIDVIYIKDNKPILLNWYIEKLGTFKRGKSYDSKNADSLRVSGCGMDMGFHLVSCMAYPLGIDYKTINQRWL